MAFIQKIWRLIALAGIGILIAAWGLALWHSHDIKQQTFASADRRMQTMAEAYASHAALSLAIADESLQRLQETLKHEGPEGFARIAKIMSREDTYGGAINRAVLVGPDGRTGESYVNGNSVGSVDVSERDYFKAFRDNPTDRVFVSEPIIGKSSGKWIVLFVRPVINNGKFAGVIFVGLDSAQWGRVVKIPETDGVLITLLSPENRIIACSHNPEHATGKLIVLPASTLMSNPPFDYTSPIDNITRRSAMRDVPDWGMRIVAGIDLDLLNAEVDKHNQIALLPALLLTLLLLPTIFIGRYALRRQQAAERERNEETARSRTVLESMSEGVLLIDSAGVITFANNSATKWLDTPCTTTFSEALTASGLSLVTEDGTAYAIADPLSSTCLQSGLTLDDAWLVETDQEKNRQWLSICAHPLFMENGKVRGAVITLVDRTDEHERITDAEMSRTILDRMNDAVMITDARASILMANAAYLHLSGFAEHELLGSMASIGHSERHDEAFWAEMWQTLTQQGK